MTEAMMRTPSSPVVGQPASSPPRRRSLEERLARRVDAELAGDSLPPADKIAENPTLRELEVFLAVVDAGDEHLAGTRLGIGRRTVRNHLQSLYAKVGARSRPHAAWLLWPVLGEAFAPRRGRSDRRLGRDRRRNP
jgi:FixJ family two-component response regulator